MSDPEPYWRSMTESVPLLTAESIEAALEKTYEGQSTCQPAPTEPADRRDVTPLEMRAWWTR